MSPTFYYSEINLIESRRVDFNLEDYNCEHYIEIKQVNLVDSRGIPDFQILQPNVVLNI